MVLKLQIQPGAKKNEIVKLIEVTGRLKIKIHAPPVDGSANEMLIRFLSDVLGISKSKIHVLRGETSRAKDVLCEGLTSEGVLKKIHLRN